MNDEVAYNHRAEPDPPERTHGIGLGSVATSLYPLRVSSEFYVMSDTLDGSNQPSFE